MPHNYYYYFFFIFSYSISYDLISFSVGRRSLVSVCRERVSNISLFIFFFFISSVGAKRAHFVGAILVGFYRFSWNARPTVCVEKFRAKKKSPPVWLQYDWLGRYVCCAVCCVLCVCAVEYALCMNVDIDVLYFLQTTTTMSTTSTVLFRYQVNEIFFTR